MQRPTKAWEVHQQLPRPAARTPRARALKSHEVVLVQKAQANEWDKGTLGTFVGNPDVQGTAWDIGPHTVLFYGTHQDQSKAKDIVTECGKLWDWLGAPRPFTLVLWWREDPRHIAAGEWPSRKTVNGGWTTQVSSAIFVYRAEEWDRVFLHEMIHALGWDWVMPAKPLACWGLPARSNTVPALFEAWTELYAEWLWCIWHDVSWSQQRAWQDAQAVQILARPQARHWRENTSVFAYYVLKAALAPHIAELLLFGNGHAAERESILCRLAQPNVAALVARARHVTPVAMSLRMTL